VAAQGASVRKEDTREMVLDYDTGLPANLDAERTILGAILLDNAAHAEAAEKLTDEDFSLDSHRRIFLRMTELMNTNHAVDIVTLADILSRNKTGDTREIESIGGVAYLASLTEGLPRRPVIREYILIVKEKAKLRRIMLVCSAAIAECADQMVTASSIVTKMGPQLRGIK
jgi:replicative DNA helicase